MTKDVLSEVLLIPAQLQNLSCVLCKLCTMNTNSLLDLTAKAISFCLGHNCHKSNA